MYSDNLACNGPTHNKNAGIKMPAFIPIVLVDVL